MFPEKDVKLHCDMQSSLRKIKQSGSALVIAIFVIIVLSLLGAALVSMLDSSQENVAFEVLGTRAYNAAQSGIQWQLAQLFPLGGEVIECSVIDINNVPNISSISGFEGCEIILKSEYCSSFSFDNSQYYTVTSTGQCQIGNEFTTRTIEVEARSL